MQKRITISLFAIIINHHHITIDRNPLSSRSNSYVCYNLFHSIHKHIGTFLGRYTVHYFDTLESIQLFERKN